MYTHIHRHTNTYDLIQRYRVIYMHTEILAGIQKHVHTFIPIHPVINMHS